MQTEQTNYFFFYPDLWLSDPALRMCSYETRGVWMDMLCYMAKVPGTHYGTLSVNGKALDNADVLRLTQIDKDIFYAAWKELIDNGVLKKSPTGFFYSKRLVEENGKRNKGLKVIRKNKEERAKERLEKNKDLREKVIEYLNEKTGRKSKDNSKYAIDYINGRVEEGYEFKHFKAVIDVKTKQWLHQKDQKKFLRCQTLFSPGHFNDYLNENEEWLSGESDRSLENAIIQVFNKKTGLDYRVDGAISALIQELVKMEFTVQDFAHVIDVKTDDWKGTEQEKWLSPMTLFKKDKFQTYRNQKIKTKTNKNATLNIQGKGYGEL